VWRPMDIFEWNLVGRPTVSTSESASMQRISFSRACAGSFELRRARGGTTRATFPLPTSLLPLPPCRQCIAIIHAAARSPAWLVVVGTHHRRWVRDSRHPVIMRSFLSCALALLPLHRGHRLRCRRRCRWLHIRRRPCCPAPAATAVAVTAPATATAPASFIICDDREQPGPVHVCGSCACM
jgi:hypothetical protein